MVVHNAASALMTEHGVHYREGRAGVEKKMGAGYSQTKG
jgi:hypothetical protein